jgi:predicted transposase/invertase (TIGR01784 family)
LRKGLTAEQLAKVLTEAADKPGTEAYIYAIANANAEKMEELFMRRKEGVVFTEKLDAFFMERYAPEIAKRTAEVKTEGVIEIARKMKSEGCDLEFISKMTGLSSKEIKRLG